MRVIWTVGIMNIIITRKLANFIKGIVPNYILRTLRPLTIRFVRVAPRDHKINQEPEFFTPSEEKLKVALSSLEWNLTSDTPLVSVIIPVHNQFVHTVRAVWSVAHQTNFPLEIIIADDCSTDDTHHFFECIPAINYFQNEVNQGFLRTCNLAASRAKGKFLFFLNNDTFVHDNALAELISVFNEKPHAGLVGAKLIYPNGKLQEAGGFIWDDASGWNFGRLCDPAGLPFNYLRNVDYVSGAAIMIPRNLWQQIDGFDDHFAPAYYEDVDLAFKVRALGLEVLYQPRALVTHFEGISSGTDLNAGVKSYQLVNQSKFHEKWNYQLALHEVNQQIDNFNPPHDFKPRLLIIDAEVPTPNKDAGSLISVGFQKIVTELGFNITFIPENLFLNGDYGQALQGEGIEVIHFPEVSRVEAYLKDNIDRFDLVYLVRHYPTGRFASLIKELKPDLKIIFNTVDLHHIREKRELEVMHPVSIPEKLLNEYEKSKANELNVMALTDATIVVSSAEKAYLEAVDPSLDVHCIPIPVKLTAAVADRQFRKGIVFIGGFRHKPNLDAVRYFLKDIWPKVVELQPDMEFLIVGSEPPDEIISLKVKGVKVLGFVEDLSTVLDQVVLSVVPLTYGAGIKGKIATSIAAGVPVVSTGIGVEGMGLEDGRNVLVARNESEFAQKIFDLYNNNGLWNSLSGEGLHFVEENFTQAQIKVMTEKLIGKFIDLGSKRGPELEVDVSDFLNDVDFGHKVSLRGNEVSKLNDDVKIGWLTDFDKFETQLSCLNFSKLLLITAKPNWDNDDFLLNKVHVHCEKAGLVSRIVYAAMAEIYLAKYTITEITKIERN